MLTGTIWMAWGTCLSESTAPLISAEMPDKPSHGHGCAQGEGGRRVDRLTEKNWNHSQRLCRLLTGPTIVVSAAKTRCPKI